MEALKKLGEIRKTFSPLLLSIFSFLPVEKNGKFGEAFIIMDGPFPHSLKK